ncbi:hypothetical protein J132_08840 [Termitomyces sp. J132]|nr:hypothetical protein J132_08840 [Termitomyces sp. J132]
MTCKWRLIYPKNHNKSKASKSRAVMMVSTRLITDSWTRLNIDSTNVVAICIKPENGKPGESKTIQQGILLQKTRTTTSQKNINTHWQLLSVFRATLTLGVYLDSVRVLGTVCDRQVIKKLARDDYIDSNLYQPIALLDTIAKVLASCMKTKLTFLAEKHNILPKHRFGGCPGHSTTDSLYKPTIFVKNTGMRGTFVRRMYKVIVAPTMLYAPDVGCIPDIKVNGKLIRKSRGAKAKETHPLYIPARQAAKFVKRPQAPLHYILKVLGDSPNKVETINVVRKSLGWECLVSITIDGMVAEAEERVKQESSPHKHTSLLVQLHTRHCPLNQYLHQIQKAKSPICTACSNTPETVCHYLLDFHAHDTHRANVYIEICPGPKALNTLLSNPNAIKVLFIYVCATKQFEQSYGDLTVTMEMGKTQ